MASALTRPPEATHRLVSDIRSASERLAPQHTLASSTHARIVARSANSRLLDDSGRTGVRPDSVQASGGVLSLRLPTLLLVWLFFGLRSRRAPREVWLQRGLLSS